MTRPDPDTTPTREIPRQTLDELIESSRCPECQGIYTHGPRCETPEAEKERRR